MWGDASAPYTRAGEGVARQKIAVFLAAPYGRGRKRLTRSRGRRGPGPAEVWVGGHPKGEACQGGVLAPAG